MPSFLQGVHHVIHTSESGRRHIIFMAELFFCFVLFFCYSFARFYSADGYRISVNNKTFRYKLNGESDAIRKTKIVIKWFWTGNVFVTKFFFLRDTLWIIYVRQLTVRRDNPRHRTVNFFRKTTRKLLKVTEQRSRTIIIVCDRRENQIFTG